MSKRRSGRLLKADCFVDLYVQATKFVFGNNVMRDGLGWCKVEHFFFEKMHIYAYIVCTTCTGFEIMYPYPHFFGTAYYLIA